MLYHTIIKSNNEDVAEVSAWADDEASARDKVSRWFADEVEYGKQCNDMYKDVVAFEIWSCCAIDETQEMYEDEWIAWAHSKKWAHAYHETHDIKHWDVEYDIPMYIIDIPRKTLEDIFAFMRDNILEKPFIYATKDGMKWECD